MLENTVMAAPKSARTVAGEVERTAERITHPIQSGIAKTPSLLGSEAKAESPVYIMGSARMMLIFSDAAAIKDGACDELDVKERICEVKNTIATESGALICAPAGSCSLSSSKH